MQVKIKRFDKSLPLPDYKTAGAAGLDLASRETITISSHQIGFIPLNVVIKLPPGFHSILMPRSSLPKLGLVQINSIGLIDNDYCGNDDEFKLFVYNYTDRDVVIEKGTRIAQVFFQKTLKADIEEVETMPNPTRGGFGTTGVK